VSTAKTLQGVSSTGKPARRVARELDMLDLPGIPGKNPQVGTGELRYQLNVRVMRA
jgi:hypothetical protein